MYIVRCNGTPCTDFEGKVLTWKYASQAASFIREISSPNYVLIVDTLED